MKKGLAFEVNGDIYTLRFTINELCNIEDLLGKPVSQLGEGSMGIKEMRVMFYCGLRGAKKYSMEEVGDLMSDIIEEKGNDYLNELLITAMGNSLGTGVEEPQGKKTTKKK
ncbi:MAG: hypothetical protein ACRDBY_13970 [Cetobacterium sp.]